MSTDLDNLVDMGFDREKSTIALKKAGNLPSAIDWLDKNADKSLEELQAEDNKTSTEEGMPAPEPEAKSMVCNDCGKRFRGMAQAQFHAEKSGHDDFSESTEEIAPLTEEEKKAKLEELRTRLAAKRAGQAVEDKATQKRNEEIRRKHTKDHEDAKEELQKKEQIKEAQKKRQEKLDDIAAKKRIREKIEADKEARRKKAEEEKAMRANPAAFDPGAASTQTQASPLAQPRTNASNATETRLRLQTQEQGNVMKTLPVGTTLFELAHMLSSENGVQVSTFTQNFPKKVWDEGDFGLTLKEAGLVPSAALIVNLYEDRSA